MESYIMLNVIMHVRNNAEHIEVDICDISSDLFSGHEDIRRISGKISDRMGIILADSKPDEKIASSAVAAEKKSADMPAINGITEEDILINEVLQDFLI